jgi:hypothetical protein
MVDAVTGSDAPMEPKVYKESFESGVCSEDPTGSSAMLLKQKLKRKQKQKQSGSDAEHGERGSSSEIPQQPQHAAEEPASWLAGWKADWQAVELDPSFFPYSWPKPLLAAQRWR